VSIEVISDGEAKLVVKGTIRCRTANPTVCRDFISSAKRQAKPIALISTPVTPDVLPLTSTNSNAQLAD
jgi:hypothetical protein